MGKYERGVCSWGVIIDIFFLIGMTGMEEHLTTVLSSIEPVSFEKAYHFIYLYCIKRDYFSITELAFKTAPRVIADLLYNTDRCSHRDIKVSMQIAYDVLMYSMKICRISFEEFETLVRVYVLDSFSRKKNIVKKIESFRINRY